MKTPDTWLVITLLALLGHDVGPSNATPQPAGKGAEIFYMPDGLGSHCVNVASDRIWLSLRRVVTNKEKGWFSEDTAVGILMNTSVEGYTGGETAKTSFPRMVEGSVADYESGHGVMVPLQFYLLNGFQLTHGNERYTTVEFSYALVRKKKRASWGIVLDSLVNITKKLPLPASPFASGFQFFTNYASEAVGKAIESEEKDSNLLKQANLAMAFSPSGTCTGDFVRTGTFAVIKAASGRESDGYIDIAKKDGYCWRTDVANFGLSFAPKDASGQCGSTYTRLQNDFIGFYLNASADLAAGPAVRREVLTWDSAPQVSAMSDAEISGAVNEFEARYHGTRGTQEMAYKVSAAVRTPAHGERVPFGKVVGRKSNGFIWQLKQDEAAAADFAEGLQRCKAHGIDPKDCFSAQPVIAVR